MRRLCCLSILAAVLVLTACAPSEMSTPTSATLVASPTPPIPASPTATLPPPTPTRPSPTNTPTAATTEVPTATPPPPSPKPSPGYPNGQLLVSTSWVAAHLEDPGVRIVDVRSAEVYATSHIPNAVSITLEDISSTINNIAIEFDGVKVAAALEGAGITPESTVVIYDDLGMMSAARLFWSLEYIGHADARVISGGWNAWVADGGPTTSETSLVNPSTYPITTDPGKIANVEYILRRLEDPSVVLLDARSPQEYSGEVSFSQRGGHIPGAVNLVWLEALTGGDAVTVVDPQWQEKLTDPDVEIFRPTDELERLLLKRGITRDNEIITYCHTLWRGAHVYFLLRLMGYDRVRGYDGSWAEWGNRPDLPIEVGPASGG